MCNLSEGVFERGMERGRTLGRAEGMEQKSMAIARNMLLAGISEDTVISCTGLSKEEVDKLKEEVES